MWEFLTFPTLCVNCVCVCVTNFVDFEGYSSEIKLMIQDCFSLIVNMYLIYNLPILEKSI